MQLKARDRKQVGDAVENFVEKLVAGKMDFASARCDLRLALDEVGHSELGDEEWLNAVLELNTSLRQNWRNYDSGLHPAILDQWPAQEFCRIGPRAVHRDWLRRWTDAGGRACNGKMIALIDDPIWYALSDFGFPFPPFALGSGMGVRAIDRDAAIGLGLIDRDRRVFPKRVPRPKLLLPEPGAKTVV
jgi:hypothetical protein